MCARPWIVLACLGALAGCRERIEGAQPLPPIPAHAPGPRDLPPSPWLKRPTPTVPAPPAPVDPLPPAPEPPLPAAEPVRAPAPGDAGPPAAFRVDARLVRFADDLDRAASALLGPQLLREAREAKHRPEPPEDPSRRPDPATLKARELDPEETRDLTAFMERELGPRIAALSIRHQAATVRTVPVTLELDPTGVVRKAEVQLEPGRERLAADILKVVATFAGPRLDAPVRAQVVLAVPRSESALDAGR